MVLEDRWSVSEQSSDLNKHHFFADLICIYGSEGEAEPWQLRAFTNDPRLKSHLQESAESKWKWKWRQQRERTDLIF